MGEYRGCDNALSPARLILHELEAACLRTGAEPFHGYLLHLLVCFPQYLAAKAVPPCDYATHMVHVPSHAPFSGPPGYELPRTPLLGSWVNKGHTLTE
jgi:hypothetical protein